MGPREPAVLEPGLIRRITRNEYRAMGKAGFFDNEGRWQSQRVARRGEAVTVAAFPDVTIRIDDILPPIT